MIAAAPLRAIDHVTTSDGEDGVTRLVAVKRVTSGDPYMPGHFPGMPMFPAVFVLEGVRQAVVTALCPESHLDIAEVRSARLLAPIWGGDRIVLAIAVEGRGGRWRCTVDCRRGQDGPRAAVLDVVLAEPGAAPEPGNTAELAAAAGAVSGVAAGPDHAAIRSMLPVRHPMLLVDDVTTLSGDTQIRTVKAVTTGEPCYADVPDGAPSSAYSYPRSLLLESFGQSAAVLWLSGRDDTTALAGTLPVLAGIRNCRFHDTVRPGDTVEHVVRVDHRMGAQALFTGESWVERRKVASVGTLIAAARSVETLRGADLSVSSA